MECERTQGGDILVRFTGPPGTRSEVFINTDDFNKLNQSAEVRLIFPMLVIT